MKNPYDILGIQQDAPMADISKGFNLALVQNMKTKLHTPQEMMQAKTQLSDPARRLAADFMYPAKPRAKRARALTWPTPNQLIEIEALNPDAHDSLQ